MLCCLYVSANALENIVHQFRLLNLSLLSIAPVDFPLRSSTLTRYNLIESKLLVDWLSAPSIGTSKADCDTYPCALHITNWLCNHIPIGKFTDCMPVEAKYLTGEEIIWVAGSKIKTHREDYICPRLSCKMVVLRPYGGNEECHLCSGEINIQASIQY